jgi:hypothetical protein
VGACAVVAVVAVVSAEVVRVGVDRVTAGRVAVIAVERAPALPPPPHPATAAATKAPSTAAAPNPDIRRTTPRVGRAPSDLPVTAQP